MYSFKTYLYVFLWIVWNTRRMMIYIISSGKQDKSIMTRMLHSPLQYSIYSPKLYGWCFFIYWCSRITLIRSTLSFTLLLFNKYELKNMVYSIWSAVYQISIQWFERNDKMFYISCWCWRDLCVDKCFVK